VLVGPSSGGKTTLLEALLVRSGALTRAGSVADGTTVSDCEPGERTHGRSTDAGLIYGGQIPPTVQTFRHQVTKLLHCRALLIPRIAFAPINRHQATKSRCKSSIRAPAAAHAAAGARPPYCAP
jgi:hypothetical protein